MERSWRRRREEKLGSRSRGEGPLLAGERDALGGASEPGGHGSAAAGPPGRKLSGKTSEPAVCVCLGVELREVDREMRESL